MQKQIIRRAKVDDQHLAEVMHPIIRQIYATRGVLSQQELILKVNQLNAVDTMKDKEIEKCQIFIKGFEQTFLHPDLHKPAKKKYAEAIEYGLLGFLMLNGFQDAGRDLYLVAHCQGHRIDTGFRIPMARS